MKPRAISAFAYQLRAARGFANISLRVLADRIDSSPNTLNLLETGKADHRASTEHRLTEEMESEGVLFLRAGDVVPHGCVGVSYKLPSLEEQIAHEAKLRNEKDELMAKNRKRADEKAAERAERKAVDADERKADLVAREMDQGRMDLSR
jgi:transcriptional regulator with XRE-family HTH domain